MRVQSSLAGFHSTRTCREIEPAEGGTREPREVTDHLTLWRARSAAFDVRANDHMPPRCTSKILNSRVTQTSLTLTQRNGYRAGLVTDQRRGQTKFSDGRQEDIKANVLFRSCGEYILGWWTPNFVK